MSLLDEASQEAIMEDEETHHGVEVGEGFQEFLQEASRKVVPY